MALSMIEIVGVRFRRCGQVHFFKSGKYNLRKGDFCWAETDRGSVLGEVVMPTTNAYPTVIPEDLNRILAVAESPESQGMVDESSREREAFESCQNLIQRHQLPMKLVKSSYVQEGKKVIFFFSAEGRVDFRGLLKDLAREFRARIELRQIGVRDEAKIIGGIGTCGRTLCCATWIEEFRPVSIKMAKQQRLSLDPQKISGVCGRLKCCLAYEADPDTVARHENNNHGDSDYRKGGSCSCHELGNRPKPFAPPL